MEGSSYLTSPLNHTDPKFKSIMMKNRSKVLSQVEASLYEQTKHLEGMRPELLKLEIKP
jgi:hypothetical protein